MKKLIIWDFDGVIADTEKLWVGAWKDFVNKKFNLNWDDKTAHHHFAGVSIKTKVERLAKMNMEVSSEDIAKNTEAEIAKMYDEMILTNDIENIFNNKNIKQCIATGGIFSKTMLKIKHLRLEKYFDEKNVFCADMVEHGKPEPDLFLFAANKMGAKPQDCIVIEDSYAGITASQRAGIDVIAFAEHQNLDKEEFITKVKAMSVQNVAHNMLEVNDILVKKYL